MHGDRPGRSRPTKPSGPVRSEDGFVLVTVLLIVALLFPLVLAFNAKVHVNLLQADNFKLSVQAVRMARSGVEGAIGVLRMDDDTFDSRMERWALLPAMEVGDGTLEVLIEDEDRKIPVNRIVGSNGAVDKDVSERLRNLIEKFGGKPDIVDALIDWIDANDEVTGSEGAEDNHYRDLGYGCKNGPLDAIDELLQIKGFDRDLVYGRKLAECLTVAPTDGKININTASEAVMKTVLGTRTAAVAQPLAESDIEDIIHYRDEHELKDLREVEGAVKVTTGQSVNISPVVKVNSDFFAVRSTHTSGRVTRTVEALLKRDKTSVSVTAWREP